MKRDDGVRRVAKRPPAQVRAWIHYVKLAAKANHARLPLTQHGTTSDYVVVIAALLTIAGTPESRDGQRTFNALRTLLLAPGRNAATVVHKLPADKKLLLRLAECVEAFYHYVPRPTKRGDLTAPGLRLEEIISVMLQLPDPDKYVKAVVVDSDLDEGRYLARVVFHPNVLAVEKETTFRQHFDTRGANEGHIAQLRAKIAELSV